jgi:hypothetical protein
MIQSSTMEFALAVARLKTLPILGPKIMKLEGRAHIYLSAKPVPFPPGTLPNDPYTNAKVGVTPDKGSHSMIIEGHTHCKLPAYEIFLSVTSDRGYLLKQFGIDTTLDHVIAHELGHIHSHLEGITGASDAADAVIWENLARQGSKRPYHN